ncbi:MAG: hypothetical protein J6O56_02520 [Bacilli bacterium]|nr:hypothetical protein [Bacilli bacterium]
MTYDYVIFCPYFGKLPVNFDLWLKSCSYNNKFKFIVFTDDKRIFKTPKNVEIKNMSYKELIDKIQSKFDFKISLNNPYKLCDYKVAYGYIFEEYLSDCKYWGYCDLDLIFGDLEKFLPKKEYDKISHLGPFSLYKNTDKINKAFMLNGESKFNYKGIFSSNVHFGFDEIGKYGINNIFLNNGFSIYDYQKNCADLNCTLEGMNVTSGHSGNYVTDEADRVFKFDNGKIIGYTLKNNKIVKKEYAYIHFQKRRMEINVSNYTENYMILHHSFENYQKNINNEYIKNNQPSFRRDYKKFIKLKMRAIKARIKRYSVIIFRGNKCEENN